MKPPRLLTAAAALAMAAVMPVPAAGGWLTGHWSRNGETVTYAGGAAFGWAVRERPPYRDGWVEVRFKPVAGREDRAGGVVWRWRDPENYYVAPANALEDNVFAYKVVKGHRTDLTPVDTRPGAYGMKIPVATGAWHTLRVDFTGDRFEIGYDGRRLFAVRDETFPDAGRVGIWSKADSVTEFDQFREEETR